MANQIQHGSRTTNRFVPVSKALRDTSLFQPDKGAHSRAILLNLQEGVDLFYWSGHFQNGLELPLRNDSNRVTLSYTSNLNGTATRSFVEQPDRILPVQDNAGSIEYLPERSGIYRQRGSLENVSVMVRKEQFDQWIDDSDDELMTLTKDGGLLEGHRGGELAAVVQRLNHELARSVEAETLHRNPLWFHAQALSMIGLFLECRAGPRVTDGVTPDMRRKLLRARDILLSDLSVRPQIPTLAKEAGMSAPSLTRGFHKLFGTSPYQLFQRERMQAAHYTLSMGHSSVTTVAMDLGYSNLSHFAGAFRKEFGVLPGEIRQKRTPSRG